MTVAETLTSNLSDAYARVLKLVEDLDEESLRRGDRRSPSIAFHAWHIARWCDRFQATLAAWSPSWRERIGDGREVWEADELSRLWHFDRAVLGFGETGMRMDEDIAAGLPFPPKPELLAYAKKAFAAAERAAAGIDDELLEARGPDLYGSENTVVGVLVRHGSHVARHLGMIEALRGAHGLRGTATA